MVLYVCVGGGRGEEYLAYECQATASAMKTRTNEG